MAIVQPHGRIMSSRPRVALVVLLAAAVATIGPSGFASAARVTPADSPTTSVASAPAVLGHESLCQMAYRVTGVTVIRHKPLNSEAFTFPATLTIRIPAKARAAAVALCALPTMPAGTYHCPVDLGVVYTFVFAGSGSVGDDVANDVTLRATGCETVTGLGATRWVATSENFWGTLGQALGLRRATAATFAGTLK